jgi:hypothetical protein
MDMPRERARKVILSLITSESLPDRVVTAYASAFVNLQTSAGLDGVLTGGLRNRANALNERLNAGVEPWGGDHFEKTVRAMPDFELEDCAEEMAHIALEIIERSADQPDLAAH